MLNAVDIFGNRGKEGALGFRYQTLPETGRSPSSGITYGGAWVVGDQRPRLWRRYSPNSDNRLAPPSSLEKRNTEGGVDCILDRREDGVNGRLHRQ
jgi:hypothetical protein